MESLCQEHTVGRDNFKISKKRIRQFEIVVWGSVACLLTPRTAIITRFPWTWFAGVITQSCEPSQREPNDNRGTGSKKTRNRTPKPHAFKVTNLYELPLATCNDGCISAKHLQPPRTASCIPPGHVRVSRVAGCTSSRRSEAVLSDVLARSDEINVARLSRANSSSSAVSPPGDQHAGSDLARPSSFLSATHPAFCVVTEARFSPLLRDPTSLLFNFHPGSFVIGAPPARAAAANCRCCPAVRYGR